MVSGGAEMLTDEVCSLPNENTASWAHALLNTVENADAVVIRPVVQDVP